MTGGPSPLSTAIAHALGGRPTLVTPSANHARPRVGREIDVIVVGGGIAGTSAAVVLAERGVRVRLLEAAPVVGGRLSAQP